MDYEEPAQYLAELIGTQYSLDGGTQNLRGPQGPIPGIYTTMETALEAARQRANEHCVIRITQRGTRDTDATVVYEGH